jgi:endonuclease YncB( thermonuclease family)
VRLLAIILATVATVTPASVHAETLTGRASIIDADTIEIHGERIRILDIDAPESRQACFKPDGSAWRCGQQAALALADWIGTAAVTCETTPFVPTGGIAELSRWWHFHMKSRAEWAKNRVELIPKGASS